MSAVVAEPPRAPPAPLAGPWAVTRRLVPLAATVVGLGAVVLAIVLHRAYGITSHGRYVMVGLAILAAGVACLAAGRRPPRERLLLTWDPALAAVLLLVAVSLLAQRLVYVDIGDRTAPIQAAARLVLTVALVGLVPFTFWVAPSGRWARWRRETAGWTMLLVGLAVALKLCGIATYPRPGIDVWHVLQGGAQALARGENPYATFLADAFAAGRGFGNPPSAYVYPPSLLLVTWPVVTLLGDVRFLHVAADLVAALLLLRLAGQLGASARLRRVAELLALFWVFHPVSWAKEWTDQLVAPFLLLAVSLALAAPRSRAHALAAGLALSLKQYLVLLGPWLLAALWGPRPGGWRRPALLVGAALATSAPFLLWDARALVDAVVGYHLTMHFRADGITAAAWLHQAGHAGLPGWIGGALAGALALAGLPWVRARGLVAHALGGTLLYLLLFFFSWHAFPNYLHFVGLLGVIGVLLLAAELDGQPGGEVAEQDALAQRGGLGGAGP